jgi:hypothetical protein
LICSARRTLQAIADQMDKLVLPSRRHRVTVAAMLADPFAKPELGGTGTLTIQLRDAIADALYPIRSYDLPEVCRSFGFAEGDGEEAHYSKRLRPVPHLRLHLGPATRT